MNNIVLIGMPGAGKSSVGVVLAKHLGYHFVDSDLVIQEEEGRLLHELIEEYGLEGFLELEDRINSSLSYNKTVIATGGSAIYGKQGMEHFAATGTIVYLKLSPKTIRRRLGDLHQRGVALKEGQTLEQLYEERIPLYEKYSDLTIDAEKMNIRAIVHSIADYVKSNTDKNSSSDE